MEGKVVGRGCLVLVRLSVLFFFFFFFFAFFFQEGTLRRKVAHITNSNSGGEGLVCFLPTQALEKKGNLNERA